MKKVGLIIFFVALAAGLVLSKVFSFGSYSFNLPSISFGSKVRGSGNVVAQTRNVSEFRAVEVGGVFRVEITAKKDFAVEVRADDNILPLITTRVSGKTLEIRSRKRFSTRSRVTVIISAPEIKSLDVSGVSRTTLKNVDSESMTLEASGASKIKVAGKTGRLNIDMSGASRIDARSLSAGNVSVDGSGASRAAVSVSEVLAADLSGASRVAYSGSPKNIKKRTSGASSLGQL